MKPLKSLFVFTLLLAVSAGAAETRIAVVNLDKVFNEFYKTKLADAQLKEQIEESKTERQELYDEFVKMQEEFTKLREESTSGILSEEERTKLTNEAAEKLKLIRAQESKIRRLDESRRKQVEEQGRRMRRRIVDEIQETVRSYANNQGMDLVIDSSGQSLNGVPLVLFTAPRVDITENIIELLNKNRTN